MDNIALIIVDIQNDYFPGGALVQEGAEKAAHKSSDVLEIFRSKGLPVIHVHHENLDSKKGFFLPGTHGAKIYDSVSPLETEMTVLKHYPNSFKETELEQALRSLGVQHTVIIGMMSMMCIDATTRAAKDLGFSPIVLHDACATREVAFEGVLVTAQQVHAAFMAALQMAYAEVVDVKSFISRL